MNVIDVVKYVTGLIVASLLFYHLGLIGGLGAAALAHMLGSEKERTAWWHLPS